MLQAYIVIAVAEVAGSIGSGRLADSRLGSSAVLWIALAVEGKKRSAVSYASCILNVLCFRLLAGSLESAGSFQAPRYFASALSPRKLG